MTTFKIFLVDDDPFFLNIAEQYLNNIGVNDIQSFTNGSDCLSSLDEKPDIIFLDYNMDTLSGIDVLKKIKRFDPNIYVVIISAQEEIKPAVDMLKYGAFDYIQKNTIDQDKLKAILSKIDDMQALLKAKSPSFIKNIFKVFTL